MKIRMQYEDRYEYIELDQEAFDEAWGSVGLTAEDAVGLTDDEREEKLQERYDEEFNRPEYNNWHAQTRHISSYSGPKALSGSYSLAASESGCDALTPIDEFGSDDPNDKRDMYLEDEEFIATLYQKMEHGQAEVLLATAICGISVQDYAALCGTTPSAVSHRRATAKKNFLKIFGKPQV